MAFASDEANSRPSEESDLTEEYIPYELDSLLPLLKAKRGYDKFRYFGGIGKRKIDHFKFFGGLGKREMDDYDALLENMKRRETPMRKRFDRMKYFGGLGKK